MSKSKVLYVVQDVLSSLLLNWTSENVNVLQSCLMKQLPSKR